MYKTINLIKLAMEFFGTFIISSSINLSTLYNTSQEIHWSLLFTSIFSSIYITKDISGGHLNPAFRAHNMLLLLFKHLAQHFRLFLQPCDRHRTFPYKFPSYSQPKRYQIPLDLHNITYNRRSTSCESIYSILPHPLRKKGSF